MTRSPDWWDPRPVFSGFEWSVARRYLAHPRGDGFVSLTAIFSIIAFLLGVFLLIVVMAVMNGFREDLLDRILGLNGHLAVTGYAGELYDYDRLADEIGQMDGIVSVTPLVEGQALATNAGRAGGAVVRGVAPDRLRRHAEINEGLIGGSLDDFEGYDAVAIGEGLARSLGVAVGDQITLIAPKGTVTPFGTAPRMQSFRVVAVFEVGVYTYDNVFVFMPLEQAQIYFKLKDAVTGLEIFVTDPEEIDRYKRPIQTLIEDYGVVTDWRQVNSSLFTALIVERNVMFMILTLIILVAAFSVISPLIMLVKNKARDIAILRSMGASRRSIMRIFMIVGSSIGIVGTLAGFVLALLFVDNITAIQHFLEYVTGTTLWDPEIRFLTTMPARLRWSETILTGVIAMVFAFLATLPPAYKAASLDPVTVLRNE